MSYNEEEYKLLGEYDLIIPDCEIKEGDVKEGDLKENVYCLEKDYLHFNFVLLNGQNVCYRLPIYTFENIKRPLDNIKIRFYQCRRTYLINWQLYKPGGSVDMNI